MTRRHAAEVARAALRGLMLIFERIDSYLEDEPSPPPPPDEWDPAGDAPPPVPLPVGMRWEPDNRDWDVWKGRLRVGWVTRNCGGFWRAVTRIGNREYVDCSTAIEACRSLAKELAALAALLKEPTLVSPPEEWDPSGDAPPPVELPGGMRWEQDDEDWDVWDTILYRRAGYVTPTSDRWLVKAPNFNHFHCDTAIEACWELAKELAKEIDHE